MAEQNAVRKAFIKALLKQSRLTNCLYVLISRNLQQLDVQEVFEFVLES